MDRRLLGATVLCIGISALRASDPTVLVSQERRVSASAAAFSAAGQDFDGEQDAASDFGPFSSTVSAAAATQDFEAFAGVAADQDSTLTDHGVRARGSTDYYIISSTGFAMVQGSSELAVTIEVQRPADCRLRGSLDTDLAHSSVQLTGPQGIVYQVATFGGPRVVDFSGTLSAGEYTLEVEAACNVGNGDPGIQFSGQADYDVVLTFVPQGAVPAGAVPDREDGPEDPLRITKLPGTALRLSWGSSCRASDDDHAVYESPLGAPLDLQPVTCSTFGLTTYDLEPAFDGSAFLVVPTNGTVEGSYGRESGGIERSPGASACLPQLLADPLCP